MKTTASTTTEAELPSVRSEPLLAAAVYHSDQAEWWLHQGRTAPVKSARFKDKCRQRYALHRMWQKAIERAANADCANSRIT